MLCTCPNCKLSATDQNSRYIYHFAVVWGLPNDDFYAKPPYGLRREYFAPFKSQTSDCPAAREWCCNHFAMRVKGFPANTPTHRRDLRVIVPAPKPQPKIIGAPSPLPSPAPPESEFYKGPDGGYTICPYPIDRFPKTKKHLTAEQWKSRMNKSDENKIRKESGPLWQNDRVTLTAIAAAKAKREAIAEQRVADIKARSA